MFLENYIVNWSSDTCEDLCLKYYYWYLPPDTLQSTPYADKMVPNKDSSLLDDLYGGQK